MVKEDGRRETGSWLIEGERTERPAVKPRSTLEWKIMGKPKTSTREKRETKQEYEEFLVLHVV